MGIGWGVLKQMSVTFKYNRSLLGKKKTARETCKEEIRKRGTDLSNVDVGELRARVAKSLMRNRTHDFLSRAFAGLLLLGFVGGVIWIVTSIDFKRKKVGKYDDKGALFTTIIYRQPDGTELKREYYKRGPKAAQTLLKNGLRHQNTESFY
ncbi:MAG: hypothetical protein AB7O48_11815 [Cyclobacteriaceae bacterium]